jgi:hypothetical protein
MSKHRIIPPRIRRRGHRDARLIVVATEGTLTEKCYFEALVTRYPNPRIHVEVLDRLDTASDPQHVIALLDEFRKNYPFKKGYDELWLVIDIDRWRTRQLSQVAERCAQNHYRMAVSNPCFEIWLLFHLKSLQEYPDLTLNEFRENRKTGERTRLEIELVNLLGSYNKSNPDTAVFLSHVGRAIAEAQRLDIHPEHRWPNDLGSRVYYLVGEIVVQSPIV